MANERQQVLHLIKELTCRLETLPKGEPTCYPSFLCERKPRYQLDLEKRPLITHASIIEVRPTHEMKRMKENGYGPDVSFVRINSPHNTHASPPWYHPCDPRFLEEKAERENYQDIWPVEDLVNPCRMPPPDPKRKLPGEKDLECICDDKNKDVRVCQWKEEQFMTAAEKAERFLCHQKHCH